MRVVMLSQDTQILNMDTPAAKRIASYKAAAEDIVVVIFGTGERKEIKKAGNVRAVTAGGSNKANAYVNGVGELWNLTKHPSRRLISTQDPFFIGIAGLAVALLRSVPLQVQIHADCFSVGYVFESPRRFLESLLAVFVLMGASCVRTVSERVAKDVRKVTRAPVSILPIRVADRSEESAERPAPFVSGFTVLAVSRLTAEKQVHILIEATLKVSDINLLIVGDGPERSRLEKLVATRGASDRIRFALWQDPHPYYRHADVFVQASRHEGYGRTLVEAALYALPIITTNVGIVGEMLHDNESAIVVSGTPVSFTNALRTLEHDSELRTRLGTAACKKARAALVSEVWYLQKYKEALLTCLG